MDWGPDAPAGAAAGGAGQELAQSPIQQPPLASPSPSTSVPAGLISMPGRGPLELEPAAEEGQQAPPSAPPARPRPDREGGGEEEQEQEQGEREGEGEGRGEQGGQAASSPPNGIVAAPPAVVAAAPGTLAAAPGQAPAVGTPQAGRGGRGGGSSMRKRTGEGRKRKRKRDGGDWYGKAAGGQEPAPHRRRLTLGGTALKVAAAGAVGVALGVWACGLLCRAGRAAELPPIIVSLL